MIRLFTKQRTLSQLFAFATASATFLSGNKFIFVNASSSSINNLQQSTGEKSFCRSMANSANDGDKTDSIFVGALRKAGIKKSPKDVTDEEWARILSPVQYAILRESDTERPNTGQYLHTNEKGIYHCAACGAILFNSETKYDSHCGWPAFYASEKIDGGGGGKSKNDQDDDGSNVGRRSDNSLGVKRTEIYCKKCNGHLGHVFEDGPQPTGERHCVNSASIEFVSSAVTKK